MVNTKQIKVSVSDADWLKEHSEQITGEVGAPYWVILSNLIDQQEQYADE